MRRRCIRFESDTLPEISAMPSLPHWCFGRARFGRTASLASRSWLSRADRLPSRPSTARPIFPSRCAFSRKSWPLSAMSILPRRNAIQGSISFKPNCTRRAGPPVFGITESMIFVPIGCPKITAASDVARPEAARRLIERI